jgi:hypothetical protein
MTCQSVTGILQLHDLLFLGVVHDGGGRWDGRYLSFDDVES